MAVEKLLSPVGRIVWGHPKREGVKTNYTTKQPVLKDGQKIPQWTCGVAFPKAEFQAKMWPYFHQEANTMYPNGVPKDFSWKFIDGDTIDEKGKPYSDREGYKDHIVLTISTEAFCPPVYKFENGAYREIAENEIKCGDFVVVNTNLKCHTNNSGGIYVNPNGFELVGYGTEIVSRSSNPDDMFGGQQHQLPQGASAQPLSSAPQGAVMPGMQTAPVQQPVEQAPQMGQMPPPATDFVQNATGQVPLASAPTAVGMNQPSYPQAPVGSATPVTTSPTNGMPGMPPAR